jgi:hypothetical protein
VTDLLGEGVPCDVVELRVTMHGEAPRPALPAEMGHQQRYGRRHVREVGVDMLDPLRSQAIPQHDRLHEIEELPQPGADSPGAQAQRQYQGRPIAQRRARTRADVSGDQSAPLRRQDRPGFRRRLAVGGGEQLRCRGGADRESRHLDPAVAKPFYLAPDEGM